MRGRGPALLLAVSLIGLVLALAGPARAIEAIEMTDPQQQARYVALLHELRCVKCQNEALADSDMPVAAEIRREIREMMQAGKSDEEIRAYLVGRYSEFILFKPRYSLRNAWLWLGPLVLLGAGTLIWLRIVRSRTALLTTDTDPVTDESLGPTASHE